jgi:hypothetical protein
VTIAAAASTVRSHWPVRRSLEEGSRIAPSFRLAVGIRGLRSQPWRQGRSSIRRSASGPWRPLDQRPKFERAIHPAERHEIAQHRFRSRVPHFPVRHRSAECRQDRSLEANRVFQAFSVSCPRFQTSGGFERKGGVHGIRDPGSNNLRLSDQPSTSPERRPSATACEPDRDARTGPE